MTDQPILPPPTIAFLRDRNGVQAVLLSCMRCGAAQSIHWEELGLPDDTPFPKVVRSQVWQCRRCDGTDITAMPDWGRVVPVVQEGAEVVDIQAILMRRR